MRSLQRKLRQKKPLKLRLINPAHFMGLCDQCGGEITIQNYGYGKVFCSVECFRKAGETYKPNTDRNRGGGVGKERVVI